MSPVNKKYRVKIKRVFWIDRDYYFPQEKIGWFPIWFNFDDGYSEDVCFATEQEALDWIEVVKKNRS